MKFLSSLKEIKGGETSISAGGGKSRSTKTRSFGWVQAAVNVVLEGRWTLGVKGHPGGQKNYSRLRLAPQKEGKEQKCQRRILRREKVGV